MPSSESRPSLIPIQYTIGGATDPAPRPAIIAHVCNDLGTWGKGFVLAISRRWPHVARDYQTWLTHLRTLQVPPLGGAQYVQVAPDLWIANLIAQHGIRSTGATPPHSV